MDRKPQLPFEHLAVYRAELELAECLARIEPTLPSAHADLRQMLQAHSTTIGLKIARGTAEWQRAEAFRTFRWAQRSAEFCESLLQQLRLAGLGAPADLEAGIALSARIKASLHEIATRIREGQSKRDVFRGI